MIELGITGSRHGGTILQLNTARNIIWELLPSKLRHGMCVGVDEQIHNIVRKNYPKCIIKGHPPIKQYLMANVECDEYAEPKDFIERDKDIVNESHVLIALPNTDYEIVRSGTWTTIRHARKTQREHYIVFPEGHYEHVVFPQQNLL